MKTSWNIASATKPNNFEVFVGLVKSSAAEHGKLELIGFVVAPGPGCNNYGLMLSGEEAEAERFVQAFTNALFPAKYGRCEHDPMLVEGQFANKLVHNLG